IEPAAETAMEAVIIDSLEAQGETILLADDELHVRETTAEVLQSMGYKVLQAKDGLEAVELFKAHHGEISLAILDVVMPHLGGMPLGKRLRGIDCEIPLIFVTGYDKDHVLGGGEQMHDSEILSKPVNFDVLNHSIRQLLD
ncbi:MAG: response regulator, partial [Mariprofundus sp.]|nr:response regulator [Mariprofundus sp.]